MDPRVTELHCIMPIENIDSVMTHGILSYERAARLPHRSVAMQAVQDERDKKHDQGVFAFISTRICTFMHEIR